MLVEHLLSHMYVLLLQLNLYDGTKIRFEGNSASESGGAIYVDFPPIRFVIDIFNRLCFMQYFSNGVDQPPQNWTVSVSTFVTAYCACDDSILCP